MNKLSYLLVSAFVLGACSTVPGAQKADQQFSVKASEAESAKTIPAMIVPEGKIVTGPPPKPDATNVSPFNQAENDARNTVKNRALRLAFSGTDDFPVKTPPFPKDFSIKQSAPNPNWGTMISQVSSPVGNRVAAFAAFELRSISFGSASYEQLLYAPTLFPPNNSILEATLYYWRNVGASSTTRKWGVWNHNLGGWGYTEPIDATFISKYVRTHSDGRSYFYSEVEKTSSSPTWRALLFNYNTGMWESKYAVSYSSGSGYNFGWAIHEPKFFSGGGTIVNCPTLPSIKMKEIQIWNGSTWNNVDSSRGSLFNGGSTCSSWSFNMLNNYHAWVVN